MGVQEIDVVEVKEIDGGVIATILILNATAWAIFGAGVYAGWNAYE